MDFEMFCVLIDGIKSPSQIRLQGTGEAFLHPEFDMFLVYAKKRGHYVDIITNGTLQVSDMQLEHLDKIGFSIDTLDAELAAKHGRRGLDKILTNLLATHTKVPEKCMIFSVYYGQDLSPLQVFSRKYKIPHIIQNIQSKTSYQSKYKTKTSDYTKYACTYIDENKMSYFFVDGTCAPCPYMTHLKDVQSKDEILELFSQSMVPKCCEQCGELVEKSRLLKRQERDG